MPMDLADFSRTSCVTKCAEGSTSFPTQRGSAPPSAAGSDAPPPATASASTSHHSANSLSPRSAADMLRDDAASRNNTGTFHETGWPNAVGGWSGQGILDAVNDMCRRASTQRGELVSAGSAPATYPRSPLASELVKQQTFMGKPASDNVHYLRFPRHAHQDEDFVRTFSGDKAAAQHYLQWVRDNGIATLPEAAFNDNELQAAFLRDRTQAQWHHLFSKESTRSA